MRGRVLFIFIVDTGNEGDLIALSRNGELLTSGYTNGFGIQKAKNLHKIILNNFLPHKTFLFKLDPKEIIKRLKKRKNKNKYDKQDIKFHKKICLGYYKISKNQKRFVEIDGNHDKNTIHYKILKKLGL